MEKHNYLILFLLFIVFLVLWSFAGIGVQAQVHTIEKSYSVEPGGTLRMNISAGNIVVRGWEYNEVEILAEVYGSPRALDNLELRFEQDRDDVIIRSKRVHRRSFRGRESERIHFTIYVPYHYHIRVNVAAGKVDVDDIDGSVQVRSSAGSIHVSNIFGPIDANASTGAINVSLLTDPGPVKLNTATGSIAITVPEDINARFVLNTAIGRVRCSLEKFTGSGNRLSFSYNDGGELVRANTAIGSIQVRSN